MKYFSNARGRAVPAKPRMSDDEKSRITRKSLMLAITFIPTTENIALQNKWFYPSDIAHDLDGIDLPTEVKGEILACAWEYTRCVIPQYSNWKRYVAFMRIIIISVISEFRGDMVDVVAGPEVLGYDLDAVLNALFHDTPGHHAMVREYKCSLLVTTEKASHKRYDSEMFRRYVNALVGSPQQWFRMRDCDALARFTIAAALSCNDLDTWYTDAQYDILCEIGDTMYDAVAFFKHRSEGETNSTFAYIPEDERISAFHEARQVLWTLDVAMAGKPGHTIVTNFVRNLGGPIHMTMRRYRFVEEGLTIGKTESEEIINETRQNFKLWNRLDADSVTSLDIKHYDMLLSRCDDLMFPGLAEWLEADSQHCTQCVYRKAYGAQRAHCFGGVELCSKCRDVWREYLKTLPERTKQAFPDLALEI
ncbi:ABA 3 protein [Aspergillus neoniger CBS 115656]|uniref:ABA 3 protein n=1 Tax=Aspergillus neoniger (strain CBS 115656) TaxID=1448310 RepID=A0A318YY84_ASPNB|nr:ABA 3 protein [Aspergillus neoniger CBS 115656]PYH29892.1 ABA 3 protein [Aspergillus neoniger CBS 115656]